MKKTFVIVALFVSGFLAAQEFEPAPEKGMRPKLSPEQHAEIKAKELTLALELNEKQIKEVKALEEGMAKKRFAKMEEMKKMKEDNVKPSDEERFKKKSEMLDDEIAFQNEMKKILSEDQFAKWKQMREDKMNERKHDFKNKNQHKEKGNKIQKKDTILKSV